MKKILSLFLAGIIFVLGGPLPSFAADAATSIVGTVVDGQGNPVQGVEIVVKDAQGNVVGQATTNAQGQYTIANLPPGDYTLTLDPLKSGLQGNTVLATVGPDGLTVNWTVSPDALAIATATTGTGFGLGTGGIVLLSVLGLGGVFGIVAGAGGFDSNGDGNVVSDSQ